MYYTNYDSIVGNLLIVSDGEYINGKYLTKRTWQVGYMIKSIFVMDMNFLN